MSQRNIFFLLLASIILGINVRISPVEIKAHSIKCGCTQSGAISLPACYVDAHINRMNPEPQVVAGLYIQSCTQACSSRGYKFGAPPSEFPVVRENTEPTCSST